MQRENSRYNITKREKCLIFLKFRNDKKYGVLLEDLQKLRQFQIRLMERKFEAVSKMDFINMVQLKTELLL
jgi:hypothetical protein